MTNQFTQPEDEILDDLDGGNTDEALEDESDQPENDEEGDELDPVADLKSQFDKLSPLAELNPVQIKSALGRIPALQSAIDRLQSQNPAADLSPRLEGLEAYLEELAEAVLGSEFTPEGSKQRIQTLRSQRASARERQSILEDVRREQRGTETPALTPEEITWRDATNEVVSIAEEKGFDPSTIPMEVWTAGRGTGSVVKAIRYIEKWMDEQEKGKTPAVRVAARKDAAGKGTPVRSGGAAMSDEQMWDDYGMNPEKYKSPDAVKRVRDAGKRLGYLSS